MPRLSQHEIELVLLSALGHFHLVHPALGRLHLAQTAAVFDVWRVSGNAASDGDGRKCAQTRESHAQLDG